MAGKIDHYKREQIIGFLMSQFTIQDGKRKLRHGAITEAAEIYKVSRVSASHIWNGYSNKETQGRKFAGRDIPPPVLREKLSKDALERLEDFGKFREYYFKRETPAYQREIAERISSKQEEKLLVLVAPGHGKSSFMTVDYPIWELIRARVDEKKFACLLMSKSENMAKAFLAQIKGVLEENLELATDYGRFKPEFPSVWKQSQLLVEGFPRERQGKEPNFIAAGLDSHIYGWKVNLILADDLIDQDNSRDPKKTEQIDKWLSDNVISRLETKGRRQAVVIGTLWSQHDIYGVLKRKLTRDGEGIWNVVQYQAHDPLKCSGETCNCGAGYHSEDPGDPEGCEHHGAYPDGCTLWPTYFPYARLQDIIDEMGSARFEFIYNQKEVPEEDSWFKPDWIEAAKDKARSTWHIPDGAQIICTIDPSPTEYAAAQVWGVTPETRFLIAQRRAKTQTPQYVALVKDWTEELRKKGKEPTWVIETNNAHALIQSTEWRRMVLDLHIRVVPHRTQSNKNDPLYGVQSLIPLYEFGKVSIPWMDGQSRKMFQPLIDELLVYPFGRTFDTVMAQWFCEHHLKDTATSRIGKFRKQSIPDYLKRRRGLVHLRSGSRRKVEEERQLVT